MRLIALIVVLAGLAFARPGPNTANFMKLAEPEFALTLKALPSCPASFELTLTRDMPDPSWSLAAAQQERKGNRVIVRVTATRKDGTWPQVITPKAARINLGRFKKGPHILEVYYQGKLVQVALLRGS